MTLTNLRKQSWHNINGSLSLCRLEKNTLILLRYRQWAMTPPSGWVRQLYNCVGENAEMASSTTEKPLPKHQPRSQGEQH